MTRTRAAHDDGIAILGGMTLIVCTLGLVASLFAAGAPPIAGVVITVLLAASMILGYVAVPKPPVEETVDRTEQFMTELDEVEFALEDYRQDVANEFDRIHHAIADFHYTYKRLLNRFSADAKRLVNKDMETLLAENGRTLSAGEVSPRPD